MARRKIHWAKRPENKAKVRRMMKRLHKQKAEKKKELHYAIHFDAAPPTPLRESPDAENQIHIPSYLYGKIEAVVEHMAVRSGISFKVLAKGMGGFLQDAASRE